MFEVRVTTKRGTSVADLHCESDHCTLGKDKNNLIVLHGWKVGRSHAQICLKEDGIYVFDLESRTGTQVNGEKIKNYGPVGESDIIQISDYLIQTKITAELSPVIPVNNNLAGNLFGESREQNISTSTRAATSQSSSTSGQGKKEKSVQTPTSEALPDLELLNEWRKRTHDKLIEFMDLRRIDLNEMGDDELRKFTNNTIQQILSGFNDFPTHLNKQELSRQVLNEAIGLGPLEDLLEDDAISEIMVNSKDQIFFEKDGQLIRSAITFTNDKAVISAIERIVAPLGRRIDESSPMVDGRLKDGSRVNAVIPPLALKGPSITIRKFMKERLTADRMIGFGSLSQPMVSFLQACVTHKQNLVISGGTGSGKTTLLNVLSNFIPDNERIITVEDAAELQLYQPNLVSLEARPPNQEGKGAVAIRELVKNCLRMRPDRIVVGECRGGEALDMLQAMNTGHDGSLTTIHSNSPRDCISRMEVLVLMSGMELPVQAIREQIASAVNIIVQQTRFSCGSRRVTSISEVNGIEGEIVQLGEIFRFRQDGFDENGRVRGYFEATGLIPDFCEDMKRRGLETDLSLFEKGHRL
ncbi:ATPase, T2SS/T4P/T4SS family [Pelagibaculum spongiae]|uniref:FHA domain-containing protein n=1 Tax=Pelagibaculum spongiae TaxID=2080658 RepID=A0A2V1GU60_9GAMM|nr:ATPase, T2SS/T4P/T4SS family [Pelagibaculum spongiae]PVZ68197.1 hypothetical protein DC094_12930 [Pelagibaculum spongiae]